MSLSAVGQPNQRGLVSCASLGLFHSRAPEKKILSTFPKEMDYPIFTPPVELPQEKRPLADQHSSRKVGNLYHKTSLLMSRTWQVLHLT